MSNLLCCGLFQRVLSIARGFPLAWISHCIISLYWLLGDRGYGLPRLRILMSLIIFSLRIKEFRYFIKFSYTKQHHHWKDNLFFYTYHVLVYLMTVSLKSYKLLKVWSLPFYTSSGGMVPKLGEYRELRTSACALYSCRL